MARRVRPGNSGTGARIEDDTFFSACNELMARRWVHVRWRKPRAVLPPGPPERGREVERITLSRFGRWRYGMTWPSVP